MSIEKSHVSTEKIPCHGQFHGLTACSEAFKPSAAFRFLWRLRLAAIHIFWHLKTKGLVKTSQLFFLKFCKRIGIKNNDKSKCSSVNEQPVYEEVLNLKPGELVEVKSEAEIMATLDEKGRNKGLGWMCNMRKFCGQRFRVYKRLERIILESTGEYRNVKNTVLLEGVLCDGEEWYGCDRSCFHFWREAWLRRVKQ